MNKDICIYILLLLLLTACQTMPAQAGDLQPAGPTPVTHDVSPEPILAPTPGLPNPASTYCTDQGYVLEIRTAEDGSQRGVCVFPDGSECDEWAYFRNECGPANSDSPISTPAAETDVPAADPAEIPTPLPVDPADYQGWLTYTHPVYDFSIMLPEDWVVEEAPATDPLLSGHLLTLRPRDEVENVSLRMTFRLSGEDTLLWPTGVGQGEFVAGGTLDVAGQPARRVYLVCPTGEITSIWYHGEEGEANIQRGDIEFAFILSSAGIHCQEGASLAGKIQHVGEMIIASLSL
jgi:putative hemolysin